MIINKTTPSKKASYNCDGCLMLSSMLGKIIPQKTSVVLPTSSPLIKLANLPKNMPIGETHAIISSKNSVSIFFLIEKFLQFLSRNQIYLYNHYHPSELNHLIQV